MVHADAPGRLDAEALSFVERFNLRHSGQPRSFVQALRDAPYLLRRFWHEVAGPQHLRRNIGVLRLARVGIVLLLGALYVISPLDLVPEAVFGLLGLVDDLMVVCIAITVAAGIYRTLLLQREQRGRGAQRVG